MQRFPSKSCSLDSLPTWLVKDNLEILLPIFTRIVNCSLMSIFPNALKQSIITPVIKKPNLDNNMLKNYRLVGNMKFMSKVIEKAALHVKLPLMLTTTVWAKFISPRTKDSTESAL